MLAFLSPWLAGVTIFFGYPLVMSVYLSFTHFDNLSAPKWIGLANYRYMLHDPHGRGGGAQQPLADGLRGAALRALGVRDRD